LAASQKLHLLTFPRSGGEQRFVWSKTDTLTLTTNTSQLIVTSARYIVISKC